MPRKQRHSFTCDQETYIAEHIIIPVKFRALQGPGDTHSEEPLTGTYRAFAEMFNRKFCTHISNKSLMAKVRSMTKKWSKAHSLRLEHNWTLSELIEWTKKNCHYYFFLEPVLVHDMKTTEEKPVESVEILDLTNEDDDYGDDYDCDHDYDGSDKEDMDINQAGPSTREPRVVAAPTERILAKPTGKGKVKAMASQPQSHDMDFLGMLQDLKETSKFQYEVEREQSRRERVSVANRARTQQQTIELGRLRVEEAKLRLEETRVREGEATKRETIRAEMKKSKDLVKMKELELEQTNQLLLLEEKRLKSAIEGGIGSVAGEGQ